MKQGNRSRIRRKLESSCCFFAAFIGGILATNLPADDWPQWRGLHRDGIWREQGVVGGFSSNPLRPIWKAPIAAGYSGPTVSDGRVYVTDRLTDPLEVERIHCFSAKDGRSLWSHRYDCEYVNVGYKAGPRASVTIENGRAFALGAMGHLHCLDAASGKVHWNRDLNEEYGLQPQGPDDRPRMPIWGIAGSPLVYKDLVIIHLGGREGACVVGFDIITGEERWRSLNDRGQYSSPIMIQQAGRDVCVIWTGDSIAGLSPENGSVHWRVPMTPRNMPIGVATPIIKKDPVNGDRLFVTSFYDGSMMLRLGSEQLTAAELWRSCGASERQTEALHSIISTPVWLGDHIYGVDSYGELRCLDAATGERIWEDLSASPKSRWSTIHFVQNQQTTWMFNERGQLIIANLTPEGFEEISRADVLKPTKEQLARRGGVCWSHPAFADKKMFARNDEELICVSLEE